MPENNLLDGLARTDTIAAIATARGVGAIGIVRISGPVALDIAAACFRAEGGAGAELPERRLIRGYWVDPEKGETLDEVLVAVMRAPRSYTGEDTVEVYGHGGPVVLEEVLKAALRAGARPAEPGEFTLRAFRSGRLDLLQAEAVAELIEARTDAARRLALRALRGGLSEQVTGMKDEALELLAHLETHLEFPMEDVEPMAETDLLRRLRALRGQVECLAAMAQRRGVYRRGVFTVITGRPNVGKSLLFNRIVGSQRALVTPYPGTTRDTVEETVRLGSVELHLVDTAGGRQAGEEVEQLGVERAIAAAEQTDLLCFLIDAQEGVTPEDERWLERIRPRGQSRPAALLLVVNKMDLVMHAPQIGAPGFQQAFPEGRRFHLSAKTGQGIDSFLVELERMALEQGTPGESELLVNERQEQVLGEMLRAFQRMEEAVAEGLTLEVIAADLWDIKSALDRLDGTRASGDLLGEVFARFCIGK